VGRLQTCFANWANITIVFTRRNFHAEQLSQILFFNFFFFGGGTWGAKGGRRGNLLLKFFLFLLICLGEYFDSAFWGLHNWALEHAMRTRIGARNEGRALIFSLVLHTASTTLCANIL